MNTLLFAFLLSLVSLTGHAREITNIPQVGNHFSLFTFEKNINPQNIMMIYTKLDEKCRFQTDRNQRDQPVFDFYWLMDGKNYKPVNGIIKDNIRQRLEYAPDHNNPAGFYLNVNDLKEMQHDLNDTRLHVQAKVVNGKCDVDAQVTLGPSAKNATIVLSKIYTDARQSFPFPVPTAVTFTGTDILTGTPVSQTYKAKRAILMLLNLFQ